MQLVQFQLSLGFAQNLWTYSVSDRLLAKMGVRKPTEDSHTVERGIKVKFSKDKTSIAWTPATLDITAEDVDNSERGVSYLLSLVEIIKSEITINEISWRRFVTYWILPKPEDNFKSLEQKYRQTMFAQNIISKAAFDSSAIFDIKEEIGFLHHQSGAMKSSQLYREYLRYELKSTPRNFLFLNAGIEDNNVIKYSKEEMKRFMLRCLPICIRHSQEFEQIWGR